MANLKEVLRKEREKSAALSRERSSAGLDDGKLVVSDHAFLAHWNIHNPCDLGIDVAEDVEGYAGHRLPRIAQR